MTKIHPEVSQKARDDARLNAFYALKYNGFFDTQYDPEMLFDAGWDAAVKRDLAPSQPQHPASEDALREALKKARGVLIAACGIVQKDTGDGKWGSPTLSCIDAALRQPAAQVSEDAASGDVAGLREAFIAGYDACHNYEMSTHRWADLDGGRERYWLKYSATLTSQPQPAEPDAALALQKYEAGPSILSNAIRTYNLARNAGSSQHAGMDAAIRQVLGAVGSDAAVARLVIAARVVAFEDQSPEALRELDKATEPFASIVPWDNEPEQGASDHGR